MGFELKFETNNAAFESPELEIETILYRIANKVIEGHQQGPVMDSNGNKVGSWGYEKEM